MKSKILILEDNREINQLLKMHLTKEGFDIIQAFDGDEAINLFNNEINLAILDVMVPKKNGFEVLEFIRSKNEIPVIFLTAKSDDADKVLALGLGADDYVTKPFSIIEIVSRCKAHLRRYMDYSNSPHNLKKTILKNGTLILNTENCIVTSNNKDIELSAKEYKLLKFFMENINITFTKKQLYETVWDDFFFGDDNTIMVHISKLREKIEPNPKKPVYIKTIKGLGYRMDNHEKQ